MFEFFIGYSNPCFNICTEVDVTPLVALVRDRNPPQNRDVVKGPDGKWLLPNDGHDMALSRRNSTAVEKVCGDEIKGLDTSEAASSLAKHLQAEEALSLTPTTDEPAPELQN